MLRSVACRLSRPVALLGILLLLVTFVAMSWSLASRGSGNKDPMKEVSKNNVKDPVEDIIAGETLAIPARSLSCPRMKVNPNDNFTVYSEGVGRKYDHRAAHCKNSTLWSAIDQDGLRYIADRLSSTIQPHEGDVVLDWGGGCGHTMLRMHETHGVTGIVLDVSPLAIDFGNREIFPSTGIVFCLADGRVLDWIPDGFFDHVISVGAVYHVSVADQCKAMREMVRITKRGGRILNTWFPSPQRPSPDFRECLRDMIEEDILSVEVSSWKTWLHGRVYPTGWNITTHFNVDVRKRKNFVQSQE
jgi:ubiquinone/menaquinone biosynthesis C-methylase UbiE